MEDSALLGIAVCTSLIGLGLLWFSTTIFTPDVVPLQGVNEEYLGRTISVNGVIEEVTNYNKAFSASFIGSDLKLFGYQDSLPVIEKGYNVTVTGEIKEYKGELEIVPSIERDVVIHDKSS